MSAKPKPFVRDMTERLASLESNFKAVDLELTELVGKMPNIPTRDEIEKMILTSFAGAFKEQSDGLLKRLSEHDIAMKKYIDDSIVNGVTSGIKAYDESLQSRYVSRTEAEQTAFATGPNGEKIPITRGAPPGQGGGPDFMGTIGKLIMNAIGGGGGGGGAPGVPEWASEMFTQFETGYKRRIQLEWQAFIKERFSTLPALPNVAQESKGHVELRG